MIESLTAWRSVHLRHRAAPLVKEREHYLAHLLQNGLPADRVRTVAAYLIHIVRVMELDALRKVELLEIDEAGERWAQYKGPERRGPHPGTSPATFARLARAWFAFHGCLLLPEFPIGRFDVHLSEFKDALQNKRGLAPDTVSNYTVRARGFLQWLSERHDDLSLASVGDVDDFIRSKRDAGWRSTTIATQCQALRTFFGYAEERGWCVPGIPRAILSPRLPKYTEAPKGPSWIEVRRLIRSVNGKTPEELRARAMILLYSIYALRSSEVARLKLQDFDWRNETFSVRRAKRGGIQQYPIQYEVGEAILEYLRKGRPHCASRHVFLTVQLPYGPLGPGGMWGIVGKRMKRMGIQSEHSGPHSLRHACATRLLRKGSSLKEIAEFLGHQDTRSVGIYAKYDKRSLHSVASFSLGGIR